jgi:oxygen-dependent protoporphyrinogen oxidase
MTNSPTDYTHTRRKVVIIGGGISGLSAAWYIRQQAAAADLPVQITVLEAADRWGGKVVTDYVDGFGAEPFVVEGGPDSFLTQKPWALQLARELGLDDRLLGTNDAQRKVYVVNKGRPVPLPDGVLLIVPTRFMPFALSGLISPLGKLRMGLDLFIPAKRDGEDETLAEFVRRRLGAEALDKIAEPLMSGIYNAEAEKQSLLATFPRFRALEEKHGSLIRGMLASRRARRAAPPSPNGKKAPALFTTFMGGTQELIAALVEQLDADLRLNAPVDRIDPRPDGGYAIALQGGAQIMADTVIATTPAYTTASLVRPFAPAAAESLDGIRYVSTGTVSLGYDAAALPDLLPGFGVVVPRSEQRAINAITISSIKFDHRAPQGHVLVRVFFGGSRSPQSMALDDADLLHSVQAELAALLGIKADPAFHRIYRWLDANPQYDVGHMDRVNTIESDLPAGLFVTGSPYRGVGMPDCVKQSQESAARIVEWLQQESTP